MSKTFSFPLRVYVEDTDFSGMVYHSNYLNFMERARTESLVSVGLGIDQLAKEGLFFVVRHVDLEYKKPAYLNNTLVIQSAVEEMRGSSLVFHQRICASEDHSSSLCEARITLVCVNASHRPTRVPDKLREVFQ